MNKSMFSKFALLAGLLSLVGVRSSKEFKEVSSAPGYKGDVKSLSKFTESNFSNLPMKRVKGKWRVRR